MTPPTPHLTTSARSLTTLREIERQEDTAQTEQIQRERLELLRERFGIELRRHGLGHLTNVRPGDRPLSLVEVMESGWWMVESE